MRYFAGLDMSLEETAICVVDETGLIMKEARAASEPEALDTLLSSLGLPLECLGLETCSLTAWLHGELKAAGWPAICIESRKAKRPWAPCRTRLIVTMRAPSPKSCEPAGSAQCM
jgi:transposase